MGACRHPETRNLTTMTVPWVRVGKTAFKPHSRLASRRCSFSLFLSCLAPIASRFRGLFISDPPTAFPPPVPDYIRSNHPETLTRKTIFSRIKIGTPRMKYHF